MASSNGSSALTEKQQQVFDHLAGGSTPSQAAAALGLRGSAVHSHIARLKAKGYLDKSGKVVKGKTPPAPEPAPEPVAATPANGKGVLGDLGSALTASRAALRETISACENADVALSERIGEINATSVALDAEAKEIASTREDLTKQRAQLEAALEALPA